MHIKQDASPGVSENVLPPLPTTSDPAAEDYQSAALPQNAPEPQTPAAHQDRSELLTRARLFLTSPQVQNQDTFAKYTFLAEKGLNDDEIKSLLRTLVCVYCFEMSVVTEFLCCHPLAPPSTDYSPENLSTTTPFKSPRASPRSCPCFFMVSRGIRRPSLYISCAYSFSLSPYLNISFLFSSGSSSQESLKAHSPAKP